MDNVNAQTLSHKAKTFLTKEIDKWDETIKHMKRKYTVVRLIYYITAVLSIVISTTIASISQLTTPPIAYTALSILNGVLVAANVKFNFEGRALEIYKAIEKHSKTKTKLDYVVSCNGDLTEQEFKQILGELC